MDEVSMIPGTPGFYKTDYTITKPGRVSHLIPANHSSTCAPAWKSIYRRSTYEDLEIIVIENNSRSLPPSAAMKSCEGHKNLKVITWQGTGFNYSTARQLWRKGSPTGEYLLLLNNDTDHFSALDENVYYAQQDRVGCVGSMLSGQLISARGHRLPAFDPCGPAGTSRWSHPRLWDVWSMHRMCMVTAACLMVRRAMRAGERSGRGFAVAFNDVDFCVRVRQRQASQRVPPFLHSCTLRGARAARSGRNGQAQALYLGGGRFEAVSRLAGARRPCMNPGDLMKEDFSFDIKPLE